MAGVRIQIDDREVREAIERLARAGADLSAPLAVIGEKLLRSTKDRYDTESDPEGRPWAPLSDETLRRKMRRGVGRGKGERRKSLTGRGGSTKAGAVAALAGAKILIESGHLRDELRYQVTGNMLELGTSFKYGATHQFGDPERNIPARPFLGLSEEDRGMVLEVLQNHLRRALGSSP